MRDDTEKQGREKHGRVVARLTVEVERLGLAVDVTNRALKALAEARKLTSILTEAAKRGIPETTSKSFREAATELREATKAVRRARKTLAERLKARRNTLTWAKRDSKR